MSKTWLWYFPVSWEQTGSEHHGGIPIMSEDGYDMLPGCLRGLPSTNIHP